MARPRIHDEELRERLLHAATEAIAAEGPDFALRPLVASVGTSTSAVYTLFGSRGELVEAVAVRAASSFLDAQAAVHHPNVAERVHLLGHAYRDWARENPSMFVVMFGTQGNGAMPGAREHMMAPIGTAVTEAVEQRLLYGQPMLIATNLFATVHGFVTLELLGVFPDETIDEVWRAQMAAFWRAWSTPAAAVSTAAGGDFSAAE